MSHWWSLLTTLETSHWLSVSPNLSDFYYETSAGSIDLHWQQLHSDNKKKNCKVEITEGHKNLNKNI